MDAAPNSPRSAGRSDAGGGRRKQPVRRESARSVLGPDIARGARGQDAIADDLRTKIESDGDYTLDMSDGKGERSASACSTNWTPTTCSRPELTSAERTGMSFWNCVQDAIDEGSADRRGRKAQERWKEFSDRYEQQGHPGTRQRSWRQRT